MKYIKRIFKLVAIFLLIIFFLPFLLYIPLVFDKNFYRDQIIQNVEKFTDYKLGLEKLDLSVYPDLRLNLQNISLKTKEKEIPLLQLTELNLAIFFLPVLAGGKLVVDDISLKKGFIDIPVLINSIPESKEEPAQEETGDFQYIIDLANNRLRIKQILIQDVEIQIKTFDSSIYHNPKIKEWKLSYESFTDSKTSINLDYGKTNIILIGTAGISSKKLDLESLFFELETNLTNFPIYEYSVYFKNFPNLVLSGSNLNIKIKSKKEQNNLTIDNYLDSIIHSIYYKNKENLNKRIESITLQGNINYPLLTNKIETRNLQLNLPGLLHLNLNSELNFAFQPVIRANINSSYVNLIPVLDFANAFSNPKSKNQPTKNTEQKTEETPKIHLDLTYSANRISFEEIQIFNSYANLKMNNTALNFNAGIRKLSDGNLLLSGEADLRDGVSISTYLEIENVNMEKFTKTYLGKKMAEGTLSTYMKLQTDNKFGEKDFLKNLTLTGSTQLKDGILLDRADILYPIRFLNKIIPTQDKLNTNISKFNFIDIDYMAKNQRFKIKNLTMQGKVFNTTGTADIGLENPSEDIHANLVVSTSIAGAGLKIPMIYSKSSYVPFSIDKVWLASVYTGMVMGGPMGAMIGSALSESANAALDTIKNKSEETFKDYQR